MPRSPYGHSKLTYIANVRVPSSSNNLIILNFMKASTLFHFDLIFGWEQPRGNWTSAVSLSNCFFFNCEIINVSTNTALFWFASWIGGNFFFKYKISCNPWSQDCSAILYHCCSENFTYIQLIARGAFEFLKRTNKVIFVVIATVFRNRSTSVPQGCIE